MKQYYTGEFAKLAGVSERTLRYYDKIGLLKPTFVMENGYRKYSDEDLIQLQKIIFLKQLGFSLEEIFPMVFNENNDDLKKSFQVQIQFINERITHLRKLKDSLQMGIRLIERNELDSSKLVELIQQTSQEEKIIAHYKDATHLNVRIQLHERYSVNPQHWFEWLYQQIDFSIGNRLLELGCGNGALWKHHQLDMRNREFFLSDISEGMLSQAKLNVGEDFSYMLIDANTIPFKKEYFDIVVANHVLFYLKDVEKGIAEISRVIRDNGVFYCSTYGKSHMKELNELAKQFDNRITLSDEKLPEKFGLENGQKVLSYYFRSVKMLRYEDQLVVEEAQPIVDYILSCHGNQNEIIGNHVKAFYEFVKEHIEKKGAINITKDAGVFICRK